VLLPAVTGELESSDGVTVDCSTSTLGRVSKLFTDVNSTGLLLELMLELLPLLLLLLLLVVVVVVTVVVMVSVLLRDVERVTCSADSEVCVMRVMSVVVDVVVCCCLVPPSS